eukprot:SM000012S25436  [mRNA]  locus=s12:1141505:1144780:+ [translate_table: standard]
MERDQAQDAAIPGAELDGPTQRPLLSDCQLRKPLRFRIKARGPFGLSPKRPWLRQRPGLRAPADAARKAVARCQAWLQPHGVGTTTARASVVCYASLSTSATSAAHAKLKDGDFTEGDAFAENPTTSQLFSRPIAFIRYVPKDLALFFAGAVAGAAAKTVTAPLDRVKLLMQVQAIQAREPGAKKALGFIQACCLSLLKIGTEEGLPGYWKGNLPQVIRVIPYSAVQLFAYELYKASFNPDKLAATCTPASCKAFQGSSDQLSVGARLAAGACAGMTSTLVTYPLDVLRLRLAVDSSTKSMRQVVTGMLRDEGLSSFYKGLGPSLLGIAPYVALNFVVFDLIKKSLPEDFRKKPQASFFTALCSATFATVMCYPLDTVRRQMQMRGSPYKTVFDAIPGIVARDGVPGLYRGFLANALKNLPNSSIRLTTYDAAKNLLIHSQAVYDQLVQERRRGTARVQ